MRSKDLKFSVSSSPWNHLWKNVIVSIIQPTDIFMQGTIQASVAMSSVIGNVRNFIDNSIAERNKSLEE